MAKKTPESKEEAAARRQRELAALTSGVAAFSLMGGPPAPAPVEAPAAPAAPAPAATPAPEPALQPAGKKAAAPPAVETPAQDKAASTTAPAKRVGEEPVASLKAVSAPAQGDTEPEADEDPEQDAPEVEAATSTEPGELDLARLFVPSSEKKGTTLRITADHQQFFTNMGFLLGNGASAPDIIHNILTRFRADHEAQIQKAMKKQLRQLMTPKK
ncbi:hypothetical protein [Hymenobacter koreensis]|uniref:DUF3408 domain-containing protein n=1 Tax=Hymenobacter koreensis TaxID=1084523 RepID=A0ABP8IY91_9BACT